MGEHIKSVLEPKKGEKCLSLSSLPSEMVPTMPLGEFQKKQEEVNSNTVNSLSLINLGNGKLDFVSKAEFRVAVSSVKWESLSGKGLGEEP